MKRPKLTDREDIKEILRGSERPSQKDSKTVNQEDSKTSNHSSGRIKATFYLEQGDIAALEKERFRRRSQSGRRRGNADLSALVREAIRKAYGNAV